MADVGIRITAVDQTQGAFSSATQNISRLKAEANSVGDALDAMGGRLGAIGAVVGTTLAAVSLKGVIDAADNFGKLAQKSGIAVDELRRFNYAASLNDVSTEALGTSLRKLSQNMAAAAGGGKEQAAAFASIGVGVKNLDGSLRGAGTVLQDIATQFANLEDGPAKAALAMALFGKAGADMIPLLNQGADGINTLGREAEQLGVVFDQSLSAQAEAFNDNLTRIGAAAEGAKISIANELLPTLNVLAQAFLDSGKNGSGLVSILGSGLRIVAETVGVLTANIAYVFAATGREIGAIAAQIAALARLDFSGFTAISDAVRDDAKRARAELDRLEYQIMSGAMLNSQAGAGRGTADDPRSLGSTKRAAPIVDSTAADTAARALKAQNDELVKQAKLLAELAGLNASFADDWARLSAIYKAGKLSLEGLTQAQATLLAKQPAMQAQAKSLSDAAKAQEQAAKEGLKAFNDQIGALNKSADAVAKQVQQLQDEEQAARMAAEQHISLAQAIALVDIARLREQQTAMMGNEDAVLAIEREIQARKQLANAIDTKDARKAAADSAKAASDEWQRAAADIERTLTDALMRAFESGKGFFESMWDTIKNTLKTTVLKVFLQPVTGALAGLSVPGLASAGQAGQGAGSSTLSMQSLTSIYNGIKTGFASIGDSVAFAAQDAGAWLVQNTTGALNQFGGTLMQQSSMLGSAAGYAGGMAAGVFAGRAISGEYGSNATVNIGTIAGAVLGGPIGAAIGGAVGGLLNRAFGMGNKQTTGENLVGSFGASGASLQAQTTWKQSGGWFRSDRSGINTTAIGSDLDRLLDQSVTSVASASKKYAELLGLNAAAVDGFSQQINISLTGLSPEQRDAKIREALAGYGDALAQTLGAESYAALEQLATQVQSQRTSLEAQLLQLQGNTVELRKRERDQIYETNRALYDQITALQDSQKAAQDFAGAMQDFSAALQDLFSGLTNNLASERARVTEAAAGLGTPTTKTAQQIADGIASAMVNAPSSAGVVSTQNALNAAYKTLESASAYAAQTSAAKGKVDTSAAGVASAQNTYNVAANSLASATATLSQIPKTITYDPGFFSRNYQIANPAYQNQQNVVAQAQTTANTANTQLQNAKSALASVTATFGELAKQAAAANTAYAAAAQARTAADTAAVAAQASYAEALRTYVDDAGKATQKLAKLREETVAYYQAQSQLADTMLGSAATLRSAVRAARNTQLSAGELLAQRQGEFASNYSMALSTTGSTQAAYADKLSAALPELAGALAQTAASRSEWAVATARLFAQSETIAQQLEASAPKDYQQVSIDLLGEIDGTLAAIESASASAEKVISDAIYATGTSNLAGLRAVIAAIQGKTVPAFATGGLHTGGLRLVGENGPELEATGPSRIYNAQQTRSLLTGADNTALVAELRALRAEVADLRAEARATAVSSGKTSRLLERVTQNGEAMQTVAA